MILAELEVHHSRPIAPTRRVAIGRYDLPVDPSPGPGGILLAGVVAVNHGGIDPDLRGDLDRLIVEVEHGLRIAQPRLRYRFQEDRVGLARSRQRLLRTNGELVLDLDTANATGAQLVLGAIYAAARLRIGARSTVLELVRKALRWPGDPGGDLIGYLTGVNGLPGWAAEHRDPVDWALEMLGFTADVPDEPSLGAVQRQFRIKLRDAHPDHGGAEDDAATRIAELTEARRILLR